ncbi:MAG: DUF3667 domain-containing protein [Proteobacteria bacterium]|nr:DUF3667 domain-containing protein [Pseudomonadota bacterium]MCE7949551.1 DUF3667 domain-containing protein [Xanthomonadales bacterium PRO7]
MDTAEAAPAQPPRCLNCGAELHGDHCHVCGQPVKGMIRPLSSMLHDVADTIFNIDSRIFHSLLPLYFRPGFLTREYFAGRRTRYVTPFRLYFFLSVLAFFTIQFTLGESHLSKYMINFDDGDTPSISSAMTPQEVIARRDQRLAQLQTAKAATGAVIGATSAPAAVNKQVAAEMDKGAAKVRKEADARLAYLQKVADAKAKGEAPPPDPDLETLSFNDKPWDTKTNPLRVGWLPAFANARLNVAIEHAKDNIPRIRKDPTLLIAGALGVLPQVLFVLMPLFALLLKIFYLFKRRLYMEHLIVALHSHAFVFLSLFLITLAGFAHAWALASVPALVPVLGLLLVVMGWWIPIYLFVMQKKVYAQGWFFTTLKFGAIGICYTIMVSLGVAAAFVISLATA